MNDYRAAVAELDSLRNRVERLRDTMARLPRRFRREAITFLAMLDETEARVSRLAVIDVIGRPIDADVDIESLVPTKAETVGTTLGVFERNLPSLVAALLVAVSRAELLLRELLARAIDGLNASQNARRLVCVVDRGPPGHLVVTQPAQPHAPPRRSTAPLERARVGRLAA